MSFVDVLIIVLACAVTIAVVVAGVIAKKKGKTCCGGDCASCKSCPSHACPSKKTDKKEDGK